jgi:hypothetical protein
MQLFAAVHATLDSRLAVAPEGIGAATVVQNEPFQRIAKVLPLRAPTAWQLVGPKHATLDNTPVSVDDTFANDQPTPFQRSTRIRVPPLIDPTAKQFVGTAHATPRRSF